MRTKLRFCLFALFALIGGLSVHAQTGTTVVKSLAEALKQTGKCDLVIDEGSTYQLQIIHFDSKYNEAILWDGTTGTLVELGEYLPGSGLKKLIKSGTLHMGTSPFGGKKLIADSPCVLEESTDFIVQKESTNPADIKYYDFVKIKGTLNENGTVLTAEEGSIDIAGGFGFEPDLAQYGGKNGYFTGINIPFKGFLLYPEMFFTDENSSSDRIDTFEKLKAINTMGTVPFILPRGTRVLYARKGDEISSPYLYLWDGKDGTYVTGPDVKASIFKNGDVTVEPGQLVSGTLTCMYFGEDNYFYYMKSFYTDSEDNLSFGDKGDLVPLEVTGQELTDKVGTKQYLSSYVQIHGVFDAKKNFVTDDGFSLTVDDIFGVGFNIDPYVNHKGAIKGVSTVLAGQYRIYPLSADAFTDEGEIEAQEIVYDARQENVINKDIPLANVTINNVVYKGNRYSTICLPFSLDKAGVVKVFGTGTQIFHTASYKSMTDADTVFFSKSGNAEIHAGGVYVIKPAKDVSTITVERVSIQGSAPYESNFWKDYSSVNERNIRLVGSYSPVSLGNIADSYLFNEDGKLVEATGTANAFTGHVVSDEALNKFTAFIEKEKVTDDESSDRIDTFGKLKAINTMGTVPFILPRGTRVLYARKGDEISSPYLYLWDGKDGTYVTGPDVKASIFKNGDVTVEPGQLVSGTLTCMYFGEDNYFYYMKSFYTDSEDNLSFGDKGDLVPLEVTGQELTDKVGTKQYLSSYVQIHGVFDAKKNFVTDDGFSLTVDDIFGVGFNIDPYVNHKGAIKGVSTVLAGQYRIYPLSADAFTDEGEIEAQEIVYDARQENVINKDIPLANVTINNVVYKGNRYSTICLPFSLDKAGVVKVFGTGTQIFHTASYKSMTDADTVFFSKSGNAEIHAGGVYVIKPAKDVSTITVERVSIQGSAPYESNFWKDYSSVNERNIRLVGSYSPVSLGNIADSYLFNDESCEQHRERNQAQNCTLDDSI